MRNIQARLALTAGIAIVLIAAVAVSRSVNITGATAKLRLSDPAYNDLGPPLSEIQEQASCLTPTDDFRPIHECYEFPTRASVGTIVTFQHESGNAHFSTVFEQAGEARVRFTPGTRGLWTASDGTTILIDRPPPDYARGFVIADGQKWGRSADATVFVPQFVMYYQHDIDAGIATFLTGHGFTGFHVPNLRDFLENPEYFEAIVLKTYRAGGVTHFWLWGDAQRGQTPDAFEGDLTELYGAIAARLGPIPGWTLGFGFDLFEWADDDEIRDFKTALSNASSYRHLIGARGAKNSYDLAFPAADFAAWEWHRPTIEDYREHLRQADNKPAFSEDRFRIRNQTRYPEKDYSPASTLRGLWSSMIAGGVANIWGHMDSTGKFSAPYPNADAILLYRQFTNDNFASDLVDYSVADDSAACLGSSEKLICFAPDTDLIPLPSGIVSTALDDLQLIDTVSGAIARPVSTENERALLMPYPTDWALSAEREPAE